MGAFIIINVILTKASGPWHLAVEACLGSGGMFNRHQGHSFTNVILYPLLFQRNVKAVSNVGLRSNFIRLIERNKEHCLSNAVIKCHEGYFICIMLCLLIYKQTAVI